MDSSSGKIKLNILAVNFPEYSHDPIISIVEKGGHFIDFCTIEDSDKQLITIFPDYIILFAESVSAIKDRPLEKLMSISDELQIPFTIIEYPANSISFNFQVNSTISDLITSPFGKNFFFKYIDELIKIVSSKNAVRIIKDPSLIINSLLTKLISQKRLDVDSMTGDTEFFSPELSKANDEKRKLEARLWTAFENKRFRVFYQPVISLERYSISGFEALIRLLDDDDSVISPDKFISVAEESAIIAPLGLWIVEEACRQINLWKDMFHLEQPIRINVNISPRQFIFPDLTRSIFEITEAHNVGPEDMAFEITESALMGDMESANMALLEFRSRNFMLYMDDFGTGYSSLSYLMHFPVNVIKIDQSFVKWMHIDDQSETIVKSIISLAHNLGLGVVAEGTDDPSHIDILKDFGCDYAQGFLFSKPLPPDAAAGFIEKYYKRK